MLLCLRRFFAVLGFFSILTGVKHECYAAEDASQAVQSLSETAPEGDSPADPATEEPLPEALSGKIIGIADGDTVTLLVELTPVVIRVYGIDAPEASQPYSQQAKRLLTARVGGKNAEVQVKSRAKDGTLIGNIQVGKLNVAQNMVRAGMAWHVPEENDDPALAKIEAAARRSKRGLWKDQEPVAPWVWRSDNANEQVQVATATAEAATAEAREAATGFVSSGSLERPPVQQYWLNTYSMVRHNETCEWFQKTSRGRLCAAEEGKPCGGCGG